MSDIMENDPKRMKMLSVRVSDEEIARVRGLARKIKKAHPYVKEADVIRELLGLVNTGIITSDIRRELLPPGPPENISIPIIDGPRHPDNLSSAPKPKPSLRKKKP